MEKVQLKHLSAISEIWDKNPEGLRQSYQVNNPYDFLKKLEQIPRLYISENGIIRLNDVADGDLRWIEVKFIFVLNEIELMKDIQRFIFIDLKADKLIFERVERKTYVLGIEDINLEDLVEPIPEKEIEQYFPKNVPIEEPKESTVKEDLTVQENISMSVTVPEVIPNELLVTRDKPKRGRKKKSKEVKENG